MKARKGKRDVVAQASAEIERRRKFSRRAVLAGTATAALTAASVGPWKIAHANEALVVNALAGIQGDTTHDVVSSAFEEKFKVKVIRDDTGTSSQDYAKIRATGGNPGWDVNASLTPDVLQLGLQEGLLVELDDKKIPNLAHVWTQLSGFAPRTGAPFGVQFLGLHYNKNKMEAPESWLDYWRPGERYGDEVKGRLVMIRPSNLIGLYSMMLGALAAGGDPETNMKPLWDMMADIEPYLGSTTTSTNKVTALIDNEELWLTPQWSTRAQYERDRGSPLEFVVPKEGTLPLVSCSGIPVGAREKELAYEWINFRLEKDIHKAFCLAYNMSPSRSDMGDDWPESFKRDQITTEAGIKRLAKADPEMIARERNGWSLRWQELMGG